MHTIAPVALAALLAGAPATRSEACSVSDLRSSPGYEYAIERVGQFVDSAEMIVRARAVAEDSVGGRSMVTFAPIEWVRGAATGPLRIGGTFVDRDDYNRRWVPYSLVRDAGTRGNCHAEEYRRGAEYLLLLRGGTPYWAALAPMNEQVRGADDPWLVWVRARATSRGRDVAPQMVLQFPAAPAARAIAGCYRLTLGAWSAVSRLGPPVSTALVRLDSTPLRPGRVGQFVAARLAPIESLPPKDPRVIWRLRPWWWLHGVDSLEIVPWLDGYQAEVFYGRRVGGRLRGVVRLTSDAIPTDPATGRVLWDAWPWAPASGERVACP